MKGSRWLQIGLNLVSATIYTPWSAWTPADNSPTCVDYENRYRQCLTDCFGDLILQEQRSCLSTEWGQWSQCSNMCGLGVKTRSRKGKYQDEIDKDDCFGCFQPCSIPECSVDTPELGGMPGLSKDIEMDYSSDSNSASSELTETPSEYGNELQSMRRLIDTLTQTVRRNEQRIQELELSTKTQISQNQLDEAYNKLDLKIVNVRNDLDKLSKRDENFYSAILKAAKRPETPIIVRDTTETIAEVKDKQIELLGKIESIHQNIKEVCYAESKSLVDEAMSSRDRRIIDNYQALTHLKHSTAHLEDRLGALQTEIVPSLNRTLNETLTTYPTHEQINSKLKPLHRKIRTMVLRAKAEAREEIAQIKKSDLQSLRNEVLQSQQELRNHTDMIQHMTQNNTVFGLRLSSITKAVKELTSRNAVTKKSKPLEKRVRKMMNVNRKRDTVMKAHIKKIAILQQQIKALEQLLTTEKRNLEELKLSVGTSDTQTQYQAALVTDKVTESVKRDTVAFHYMLDVIHGRKMGQKPHPFTVPVLDTTDGAFLISGSDCYGVGGRGRLSTCAGTFRCKVPGIYQFMLTGSQILTNKTTSQFTGWIKLNGKAYTGSYSNAAVLPSETAEGRLNTVSVNVLINLNSGDEISTMFVRYYGDDTLATGQKTRQKFSSFSGICLTC